MYSAVSIREQHIFQRNMKLKVVQKYSVAVLSEAFETISHAAFIFLNILCREGLFILPYNELAIAQGPKIYQKNEL